MGVDTTIVAMGTVTDEQIERFNQFVRDRSGEHAVIWFDQHETDGYAERRRDGEHEWVEVMTLERYYGPRYERGRWPLIYATIIAARHIFSDAVIHYGPDYNCEWENLEATDEHLAEIWAHWASPEGNAYSRP